MLAQDLGVEREQSWLFRGVSFEVHAGELWYVRGPNGVGKTTLLSALAGVRALSEGRRHCSVPVAWIPSQGVHITELSLEEHLSYLYALRNKSPLSVSQLKVALTQWGLESLGDHPLNRLSQGQRQRGHLSHLSLMPSRSLWLLDEPDTGLDTPGLNKLKDCLDHHLLAGGAVMMATHRSNWNVSGKLKTMTLGVTDG